MILAKCTNDVPPMLSGKSILIGVSGSIAAYKSAILTRLFVKTGASVTVVMSPSAKEFITPLTLSTLSKNPVHSDFVSGSSGQWNNHVELALKADLFIIAPASANTIAKAANGMCDNLLMATYFSAKCPVYIAPAMDLDMYKHPATVENLKKLLSFGNILIPAATGELASGLYGEGRMAEPEAIMEFIEHDLHSKAPLRGKTALVTAGPTHEAIDPVRFICNHSTGKMGFALAEELASKGALVHLISGPSEQESVHPSIKRTDVISAKEMYDACLQLFDKTDIAVMTAAVADFTPKTTARQKIKKQQELQPIELVATKDILAELGRVKSGKQFLVGFALETENELENARKKINSKNLDFIVLNSLQDAGAGFGTPTNKITIIDKNNKTINFELKQKREVAKDIVDEIVKRFQDQFNGST